MKMSSTVSVIIPAFNAAKTLARALESVYAQDYPRVEVIVVDDGSSDDTVAVAHRATRGHAQIVSTVTNSGASAARNRGITEATGDYIAFLDADDVWLPSKLSRQVQILDDRKEVSLVTCDSITFDSTGNVVQRSHGKRPPVNGPDAWRSLLATNFIPTPTVLARRTQVLEVGAFNPAYPVAEDLDLWIRLALQGEVVAVPEVMVHVHVQPRSLMSRRRSEALACTFAVVQRYLNENRHCMTSAEVNDILGRRCFEFAAYAFDQKEYLSSIPLFWRAALLGYRPMKSSVNVPRALLGHLLHGRHTAEAACL
jgi:glycosyltransferase involved in cell wall biosynthesis